MNRSVLIAVLFITLSAGSLVAWGQTATPTPARAANEAERRTLNLAALKDELRNTRAIGLFTKIALKNQVDDLLERFQAHHANGRAQDVVVLRRPYDMLVLKVLVLLQDSDPVLASTIAESREDIWQVLADRERFLAAI